MYCSQCSCQLPSDAQFCLRCGASVAQQAIAPCTYYCVHCGATYESSFKFCNFCGQVVIQHPRGAVGAPSNVSPALESEAKEPAQTFTSEDVAPTEMSSALPDHPESVAENVPSEITPSTSEPVAMPLPRAPIGRLVLLELGTMLAFSTIVFGAADDLARRAVSVWIPLLAAICGLPILIHYVRKSYLEVKALGALDEAIAQAGKRLLKHGFVFTVLFMITASIVGYAIGVSGSETEHLVADFARYHDIGKRIGEQRRGAANTIPSYVEMYDKLEADVRAYSAVCAGLNAELTVYDTKYPSQHQTTENTLRTINNESRRADLLLKQIEVARRLRWMSEDQQLSVWQNEMKPLLDQEIALDSTT